MELGFISKQEFLGSQDKETNSQGIIARYRAWLKEQYGGDLYKRELDEKLSSAPRVLEEVVSTGLVSRSHTGIIAVPDKIKVAEFLSQVRKIFHSNPRLARWLSYYLLSRKNHFSTEEFTELASPAQLVRKSVQSMGFTQVRQEGKLVAYEFDPILDEGTGYRLFVKHGENYEVNPKFKVSIQSLPPCHTPTNMMF